jgi:hypothetical protein
MAIMKNLNFKQLDEFNFEPVIRPDIRNCKPENKGHYTVYLPSFFEPTVFPDRIMLTIPGDPATSRAVTWRTSFEVTISAGEIAILDASPKFDDKIKIAAGLNSPWEEGSQTAMGHKIIFENLQPETKYAYRVGDGKNWSEWFQFKTSSAGIITWITRERVLFRLILRRSEISRRTAQWC